MVSGPVSLVKVKELKKKEVLCMFMHIYNSSRETELFLLYPKIKALHVSFFFLDHVQGRMAKRKPK